MKLFTHPGASSTSVHILLHETGLQFETEIVNVTSKTRADGSDYRLAAERGMVPLLELEDGTLLTENSVIAQYICDRAGRLDLMPRPGSIERLRVMEWQSFIAAELHKSFSPLFWPIDDAAKSFVRARILQKLTHPEAALRQSPFLTGQSFTAADAYLFVIASWGRFFHLDFAALPSLLDFLQRVERRPSVQAALASEGPGLIRSAAS
jgi:glutathione S-transferase